MGVSVGVDAPGQPLLGVENTRRIEQQAAALLPPHELMRRAGAAVAELALALAPHAGRMLLVAGGGNNGGDALEAATRLRMAGKRVEVALMAANDHPFPDDAADALRRARIAGMPIIPGRDIHWSLLEPEDLIVDGLLGIGARAGLSGLYADLARKMADAPAPTLAIDVPSGLDADHGHVGAGAEPFSCVRADHTLSLLTLKPGLFTASGRDHAGQVWFHDLGVPNTLPPDAWLGRPPSAQPLPPRLHAQHKGSFGEVLVIGGAPGMRGAALLAARSALAAGAGRVYLHALAPDADSDPAPGSDPLLPELMFRRTLHIDTREVVVCGCGGGADLEQVLSQVLKQAGRAVLDADALNALAASAPLQQLAANRRAQGHTTILTPHPLEAARLLGRDTAAVQAARIGHAQRLADHLSSVVVLKGSGTIIAAPGETPIVNPTGNPLLATAGTGDVLAGWIGALWAAGLDAWTAACEGVRAHGARADALAAGGRTRITASELLAAPR